MQDQAEKHFQGIEHLITMTEASRFSALLKTWVTNYSAKSLPADVHPLSSHTAAVLCISTARTYACAQLKHHAHTKWLLRPILSYKSICTLTSESLGVFFFPCFWFVNYSMGARVAESTCFRSFLSPCMKSLLVCCLLHVYSFILTAMNLQFWPVTGLQTLMVSKSSVF